MEDSGGRPKLPFLNEINMLRNNGLQDSRNSKKSEYVEVIQVQDKALQPTVNSCSNIPLHLGYIENRPQLGELPFLEDIKKIGASITTKDSHLAADTSDKDNGNDNEKAVTKSVRFLIEDNIEEKSSSRENPVSTSNRMQKSKSLSQVNQCKPHSSQYEVKKSSSLSTIHEGKKSRKPRRSLKIDENTNVNRLATQIIPQLNLMQKNLLGLLFYNELSQDIIDEITAQKVCQLEAPQLAELFSRTDEEVNSILYNLTSSYLVVFQTSFLAAHLLLNCVREHLRKAVLGENFGYLSNREKAAVLFSTSDNVRVHCFQIISQNVDRNELFS